MKASAMVTIYGGHRRALFFLPGIISLFIIWISIIRNNCLVGRHTQAEVWTPAPERITLYCTWHPGRSSEVSDIGKNNSPHRLSQKIWDVSCTECTGQWNDFDLIPVVEMETIHPIEGSFVSKFLASFNHWSLLAAGSLKLPKHAVKWIQYSAEA